MGTFLGSGTHVLTGKRSCWGQELALPAKRCKKMPHRFRHFLKFLTPRAISLSIVSVILVATINVGFGAGCPGNPDAIGSSRVLPISPQQFSRIGSMQYNQAPFLNDHDVVLTFD